MLSAKFVVAAAFAGLAAAQIDTGLAAPWNQCCNITNPGTVAQSLRQQWCQAQYNSCLQLCGDNVLSNRCDAGLLTYDCQCYSGNTPNISDYAQTLPSLQCQQWSADCNTANAGNSSAQDVCQNVNCGHKNASEAAPASSSSSSASSTATSSTASSQAPASATSAAAPSSSGAAAGPLGVGREVGTGIVGAVLFGVFGFFL